MLLANNLQIEFNTWLWLLVSFL